MRFLFLIILLPLLLNAQTDDELLSLCRSSIDKAFKEEAVAKKMYEGLQHQNGEHNLLYGYRGAVEMSFGKHESGLIKKGKFFSSGKGILEEAISKDSKNIELIFLRYTIQYNVPGFLGYDDNLEEDRAYLEKAVQTPMEGMGSLKVSIREFLKNNQPE